MYPIDAHALRDDETVDTIVTGSLKLLQPKRGYRFSTDSILLAGLTRVCPQDRVVDLGTGCGVIPLLLAFRRAVAHVTGIEIQEALASMARRNVEMNGLSRLIKIVKGDLRKLQENAVERPVTLVVSNPPYRELGTGRLNPNVQKAAARHEVLANLVDVVRASFKLLPHKGRLALIYPARRLPHLFSEVKRAGFTPTYLTLIYATLDSVAKLVHLESVKGGGQELQVNKPFAMYQSPGVYAPEMAALYRNASAAS